MLFTFTTIEWPKTKDRDTKDWTLSFTGFMPKPMWRAFARRSHAKKPEKGDGKSEWRYWGGAVWWITEQGHEADLDGEKLPRFQNQDDFQTWLSSEFFPKKMGDRWTSMKSDRARQQREEALRESMRNAVAKSPRIPLPERAFAIDGPCEGIDAQGMFFVRYRMEAKDSKPPEAIFEGVHLMTKEIDEFLKELRAIQEETDSEIAASIR